MGSLSSGSSPHRAPARGGSFRDSPEARRGKVARDVKADWNGNGAVKHGDTFETKRLRRRGRRISRGPMPDDGPRPLKGLR